MSKAPRWNIEGDDAAELARAIAEGVVTNQNESLEQFIAGPRKRIGHKFSWHLAKGKRNLKANHLKLNEKVKAHIKQRPHPDNGKRKQ